MDNAIKGLPVPVVGPAPPGISVHDAIKVKLHDFYYTTSYTMSSYDIVHNIVYENHLDHPEEAQGLISNYSNFRN